MRSKIMSFSDFLSANYGIRCDRCPRTRQTRRAFVKHLGRYHRIARWQTEHLWAQWRDELKVIKKVKAIVGPPAMMTGSYAH